MTVGLFTTTGLMSGLAMTIAGVTTVVVANGSTLMTGVTTGTVIVAYGSSVGSSSLLSVVVSPLTPKSSVHTPS